MALTDGLVVHYTFDGNANDISGNNNHGTVSGATLTTDRFGESDKAYSFNGSTDYIIKTTPSGLPSGNNPYTITAWVNFDTIVGTEHFYIGIGDAEAYKQHIAIGARPALNDHLWVVHWGLDWDTGYTLEIDTWYHFVITYDGTTEKLYVNAIYYSSFGPYSFNIDNSPLVIGGLDIYGGPPQSPFSGKSDEIRIYDRVITEEEILKIYYWPIPQNPTGISVVSGEELNTITFTVDPEADETHLYWLITSPVTKGTGNKISDISSPYEHVSLDPSETYYYILTSENEEGEGDASSEYSGSPLPTAPLNVIATPGVEKIIITFDTAIGADSYNIYWKNSSPVTKINGTKITGITSPHEHTSLNPDLTYYYVVTTVEDIDESDESNEINASPIEDIPDTPTNFEITISKSSDSEIVLTWNEMEYANYYDIYYSTDPNITIETGTKIGNITNTQYNHINLLKGTYYYIIIAVNEIGESIASNEINYTVLFEGKIFNHTEQIKNNLLYQYQGD